jgi:succinate dehydrogenase/fumarate reductase cytochrome b subunit
VGDVLLVAAVIFHGLNGLRVILLTFGLETRRSGLMFGVVLVASAGLAALAAWGILLA